MKRRKAIGRILLVGGGTVAAYTGYKWYDLTKKPDLDYLEQHRDLIADLAETIIPATDTPGAKEAGVPEYILIMIRDCTNVKSQNKFIDGLKELEHYCSSQFGKPFGQCTDDEKNFILKYFEAKAKTPKNIIGKIQVRVLGKPFFTTLKEYTAEGYCTSEIGATKGMVYVPVPGKYIHCMPLEHGQKCWATR